MAASNDKQQFLALIEGHKKILYKVANAYCKNAEDRADLIQDMLIQLWQSFRRFDERCQFSTWMYRVAMNVAISFYRSEGRRIRDVLPIEDFALDLTAADQVSDTASDNMAVLQKLLGQLDEMNRALVILFLDGLSYDEIAEVIGISASNVGTRLNRLKQQLQREFAAT
jgi:RNA polymerase sigma factor (sigma-70 family)